MRIEIQVDPNCKEPKLLILTNQVTNEIRELVRRLSVDVPQILIGFDLSFTGTIGVRMSDGTTSYASRRYVSKIKQRLEM
ncbi:hypothetical protein BHK98_00260 [Hornefia porci]|uniref:Uncharacterized protein n=1 Tax=Hornefia porci TaxID=2652292 RepID=A0A1Q9JEN4_9FIRM|nr:hypothetical protein [Hornefia porci]OLR54659.1 hypothetical protein BHK98_00260 [Hornefia porci]